MGKQIDIAVRSVLSTYPKNIQKKILVLRTLIHSVAKEFPELGEITETLRWNEPTYIPKNDKMGTAVRIAWYKKDPNKFGIFVNCHTSLIDDFKKQHKGLNYQKTRAIIFDDKESLPIREISQFIRNVFTYYLKK